MSDANEMTQKGKQKTQNRLELTVYSLMPLSWTRLFLTLSPPVVGLMKKYSSTLPGELPAATMEYSSFPASPCNQKIKEALLSVQSSLTFYLSAWGEAQMCSMILPFLL